MEKQELIVQDKRRTQIERGAEESGYLKSKYDENRRLNGEKS
jgi:hypothetical protein